MTEKRMTWKRSLDGFEDVGLCEGVTVGEAICKLADLEEMDPAEVVHGRWEKAHIAGYLKCSCCKDAFIYEEWLESGKWNYCPNCGAKMDGGNV